MTFTTNLTESVKELIYAENHHYLTLTDKDGNQITLLENSLVCYKCSACTFEFYSNSNAAQFCGSCGSLDIKSQWTKPQIALIPESESDFSLKRK